MDSISPEFQQGCPLEVPRSIISLRPALWLDLEGGVLIREQEEILLTARELAVLRILVRNMFASRSFLSATALARQIAPEAYDPEHCIEQNISMIRRKLGELPRHPSILKGRRGLGYRLYPEL